MQDLESALSVIQHAVHNEVAGQRFYNDAALYCIDPWAKEIFAMLAREEEGHTQLLLAEYEALKTQGRWLDPDTALASGAQLDITRFTFSEDESGVELFPPQRPVAEAVDRSADDLDALAFGIRKEEQSIALYRGEADRHSESAAQQTYRFLLEEEARHYRQLKEQWEKLAGIPFD